jgi:hypothetical protein
MSTNLSSVSARRSSLATSSRQSAAKADHHLVAPKRSEGGSTPDPESSLQERFTVLAWLVFHLVALWSLPGAALWRAKKWWQFKRICAWHRPAPIRFGGNPFARRSTHGMCPKCAAQILTTDEHGF